jgi:hypothetical protein
MFLNEINLIKHTNKHGKIQTRAFKDLIILEFFKLINLIN